MFEKEAEEYRESKRHKSFREDVGNIQIDYNAYLNNLANAFKDGAEFGFQKGIKAKINTTTISDCPIKDEWHNVKDGDLPKDERTVLSDKGITVCYVKILNKWVSYPALKEVPTPIAWCEIPKYKE